MSRLNAVLILLTSLLLLVPKALVAAEAWYISDDQSVTMRSAENSDARVVRVLTTGARLSFLQDGSKGWSYMRTEDGMDGWVLKRYLTKEVPPRIQLDDALKARQQAERELETVRGQLQTLNAQATSQKKLIAELEEIRSVSKNAVAIKQQNDSLQQELESAKQELSQVSERNRHLERQKDTQFFLAGGAVLVLGFIGGALLARRRRSGGYNDLM
ncbi:MAG: TIGR04211 family SH3 domain-containing protein [Magnetococcales bacterium]|nr:TIGR04211 family SH3 domain-containing protein [Magnetococcales bacterium]